MHFYLNHVKCIFKIQAAALAAGEVQSSARSTASQKSVKGSGRAEDLFVPVDVSNFLG
jgi:hypothetical protein